MSDDLENIPTEEEEEVLLDPEPDPRRRRHRTHRVKRADPRRRRHYRVYRRADPAFRRKSSGWMPAIKTALAIDLGGVAGKLAQSYVPATLTIAGHSINALDLAAGALGFVADGMRVKHGNVINQFTQGMLSAAIGADPAISPASSGETFAVTGGLFIPRNPGYI